MQGWYAAAFEREMGCTEAEWLSWLPGAVRGHALTLGPGQADVVIGTGRLQLRWQTLEPRKLGLARFARLQLRLHFDDAVDEAARQAFMRYFDLYMHRGGG